jgi:SAM-dependent methyltransferase
MQLPGPEGRRIFARGVREFWTFLVARFHGQKCGQRRCSAAQILYGYSLALWALPFADNSFDAVCEFAILHHVAEPQVVISEMLRVARKAIIISDSNRFGQGPMWMRFVKLALYKVGLWGVFNYLRTSGKRYQITEGDGLSYSYSVYDNFDQIAAWADRMIIIPADKTPADSWLHPLLTSGGVILCGIRER